MFLIFFISLLIPDICLVSAQMRIFNGHLESHDRHPYVVSVQSLDTESGKFYHFCGGTIVSPKFVVSAGHCYDNKGVYAIKAGIEDAESDQGRMVNVAKVINHPKYVHNYGIEDFDIAMLLLTKPLKMSKRIRPVRLPEYSEEIPAEEGTVIGWGAIDSPGKGPGSRYLRSVEVPVLEYKKCMKFDNTVNENKLCTMDHGVKGFRGGDSGGPLIIDYTLFGICSTFDNVIGIFTKVSKFIPFINSTLAEYN